MKRLISCLFYCRLFVLLSILYSFPGKVLAEVVENKCISPATLKYFLASYTFQDIDKHDNITKQYSDKDICDTGVFNKTVSALDFIRKMPKVRIPTQFRTILTKEGNESFLNKRIKIIRFDSSDDSNGECKIFYSDQYASAAYVINQEKDQKIMHICPSILKIKDDLAVASLLVHEARHIDGFRHEDCKSGFFKPGTYDSDTNICDESYEQQGAYAMTLNFYIQAYFSVKNKAQKMNIKRWIVFIMFNHFNQLPKWLVKGGVILDDENNLSFYDGKQETILGSFVDKTVDLTMINGLPTLFFANGGVIEYDFTKQWLLLTDKLATSFKKLSVQERELVLDAYAGYKEHCFLFPARIRCMADDNDKSAVLLLPMINPMRFEYNDHSPHDAAFVIGRDGIVYRLPDSNSFDKVTEKDAISWKEVSHYPDVTSYVEMEDGRIFGISPDGHMLVKKNRAAPWEIAKDFGKIRFKKIIPFYWSKQLEAL